MSGTPDVSVPALARVLEGERAETVVREVLRAHRDLDDAGRARVARRVYGSAVLRARLAFFARIAEPLAGAHAGALVDAYVRFEEEGAPLQVVWPAHPLARMVCERSAPPFMVRELVDALGLAGADAFLAVSNVPAPAALRTNTLKITRDALRAALGDEGIITHASPLAATALLVEGRGNFHGSPSWRAGLFEVQDASSQVCAALCEARPGDIVVDLCAGRGGKTLALAATMENQGTLYVYDVDARALADMSPRLRRAGVTCVRPLPLSLPSLALPSLAPPSLAPPSLSLPSLSLPSLSLPSAPSGADVVLVDAPCSSWGPLRRSPDLRWTQTVDELAPLPALQRALLARAHALVKPGGRVVYATCTVRRAENEDVVAAVVDSGALVLVAQRTLLPHVDGSDGGYVAVLTRA